ncbi:MAG TPA: DUF2911 domain-containing protein [Chryseosolibacter sp.]|nr:DUF2911 domain-containing protein [Chryseosolibacter sp.]
MTIRITLFVYLLLLADCLQAQELLKPRPSPLAIASVRYKDNYIKITYSQPQRKNREIFGQLVPFGTVWRTGANEATEITTTTDIQIDSFRLAAGTYSIFSIPEKDRWTVIINADVGLWGAYNYNPQKDVVRFPVPVQATDKIYEPFTIIFDHRNEVADLLIMWDRTKVSIPIKFLN